MYRYIYMYSFNLYAKYKKKEGYFSSNLNGCSK